MDTATPERMLTTGANDDTNQHVRVQENWGQWQYNEQQLYSHTICIRATNKTEAIATQKINAVMNAHRIRQRWQKNRN